MRNAILLYCFLFIAITAMFMVASGTAPWLMNSEPRRFYILLNLIALAASSTQIKFDKNEK